MAKIIAELCQNHNGSIETLKEMICAAAEAGATYAKMQSLFADDLTYRERFEQGQKDGMSVKTIKRPYRVEYERLRKLDLDRDAHVTFLDECKAAGIRPLTTIFARSRIPMISDLGFKDVKVASYDCASYTLIRELMETFEHLYISTGATFDDEVEKTAGMLSGHSFSFLHCVTIYPTPLGKLNLNRMKFLRKFTKEVGFSDHTFADNDGLKADIVALFTGADVIERHFTLLPRGKTKDGPVSIDYEQLKELVEFSKMNRDELREHVLKIPNYDEMIKSENLGLSDEELLNRDYYRGRFASKINGKVIFNWESDSVF